MTIYYTTVFFILVLEMISFGVLVFPLPSRWRRAMFRFVSSSPSVAKAVGILKIVFGFIFVLFIDAVNRLQRIEQDEQPEEAGRPYHDYGYEASQKARKFYAQRNLYLTGFTLFLSLILERTSTLVIAMLKHEEELEYAKGEHASSKLDEKKLLDMEKSYEEEIKALQKEVEQLQKKKSEYENLKRQAEQGAAEYHKLADEHTKLGSTKN
ncbi:B-cell receptor-associated protein 31-like-domain-containing protein [Parasitella parasitica]|nr:B-cell receptor-associated protein 31-like-domain-containing protein [Parasitella parasitica]